MADVETKLRWLSERGIPVGVEEMIERIEADLAGDPVVIVNKRREGTLLARTQQPADPERSDRLGGPIWAAAAFVVVLAAGAFYLGFSSDGVQVADTTPTPTTVPVVEASPSPGFSRFNSPIHGISIDFPSGWQVRSATEPWTQGELDFYSPAADVIFDPALGESLYIVLASRSGTSVVDSWPIAESGVCDPQGGFGFGSITVDGAGAWYQDCAPGISGATDVSAVTATTPNRRYLIVLVRSGESGLDDGYDFEAALETVDLRPEEAR